MKLPSKDKAITSPEWWPSTQALDRESWQFRCFPFSGCRRELLISHSQFKSPTCEKTYDGPEKDFFVHFSTEFHFPLEKNVGSLKTSISFYSLCFLPVTLNQCALYKWLFLSVSFIALDQVRFFTPSPWIP